MSKEVATQNTSNVANQSVFTVPFKAKDGANEKELVHAGELMLGLYNVYDSMQKSYSDMCGYVAQLIATKAWENYYDCKGINPLVKAILHCSDSTTSELVKVAKGFYNSNGTIVEKYGRYNYSMLLQLSRLSDDERKIALSLLEKVNNFTRDHVKQLVEYIKAGKDANLITVENDRFKVIETTADESTETTADESTETTADESTETTADKSAQSSTDETKNNKTESAKVEQFTLSKEAVETVMNKLIKVRVDIDKLTKAELKNELTAIIEELGIISK